MIRIIKCYTNRTKDLVLDEGMAAWYLGNISFKSTNKTSRRQFRNTMDSNVHVYEIIISITNKINEITSGCFHSA